MAQRPVNILLVDDQPNNLLALEAMLSDMGENLVRADSGTRALKALLDDDYSVILLDVQMPELDGFETARLIRQRERSRYTPIIFVTALSRSETNVFHGYSLGAVDYLFKPIVPEILRSKVSVFVELFRKTEELRRQAREVARLNRQNQLILNSAAEGIVGLDRKGITTFVNPAAANMLKASVDELIGKRVHDVLHPKGLSAMICHGADCPLHDAIRGDDSTSMEDSVFWRRDGSEFPAECIGTPMLNEKGEHRGAVMSFRDVTERRAAAQAQENERLYREAQAANRAKDDFLATLSHELRTPMTAIVGWVRMLRMGDLDQETTEMAVEAIERSAGVQAQLIDDILDVSRIVAGKLRLQLEPVDLQAVIERAIATVRHTADDKRIELAVEYDEVLPQIVGDSSRLQQVIWNLLSNAIKFTPELGKVIVGISENDGGVAISITDTGEGIDPTFLPHVFDRFRQQNSSHTRSHGGLGLGLAIVRHLTEAHSGKVEAHSEGEGKGATFVVKLPPNASAPFDPAFSGDDTATFRRRERFDESMRTLRGLHVLVVDDDDSVRQLLETVLVRSGAQVAMAASVKEAIDEFGRRHPDIIVSDIGMPGADGYDLIAQVRALDAERGRTTPIIALTAHGRDEDHDRVMAAGFQRYLKKPIDPSDFVEAVASVKPAATVPDSQA